MVVPYVLPGLTLKICIVTTQRVYNILCVSYNILPLFPRTTFIVTFSNEIMPTSYPLWGTNWIFIFVQCTFVLVFEYRDAFSLCLHNHWLRNFAFGLMTAAADNRCGKLHSEKYNVNDICRWLSSCVFMCLRVYVYMYVCVCVFMCVCTCIYICVCVCVCVCVHSDS